MTRLCRSLLLFSLIVGALGACTPLTPVKNFGTTTGVAATTADDAFTYFNVETINAKIDARKFENLPIRQQDTEGPLETTPGLRTRQNALRALSSYATGLETLASREDADRIDAAAASIGTGLANLSESTASLTGNSPALSSNQTAVISTLVSVAGRRWVVAKRRKAVCEVVTHADPGLQEMVGILSRSLTASSNELQADMTRAKEARVVGYNRRLAAGDYADVKARNEDAADIEAYSKKIQQVPGVFAAASKSLDAVGKAHAKLNLAAQSDKFDLAVFSAEVAQLRADVAQLEKAFAAAR